MAATAGGEATVVPAALAMLRLLLAATFIVAVPLFLISTNVRWLTEDRGLYLAGFAKYRVSERTGLSEAQLRDVADAFIRYFQGPPGLLAVQVDRGGGQQPLFNEREVIHMRDVQQLVHGFHAVQLGSGIVLIAVVLLGLLIWRQSFLASLGWFALLGAVFTLALLGLVGALALLDFQSLFLRFHLVSFRNDFWMLDPQRDYLIMLFPLGFWFDATLRLAAQLAAGAVAVALVSLAWLRLVPVVDVPR